jgi:hypothetical protein
LASHLAELQKIKAKLSVNQLAEPLFDRPVIVDNLEAAHLKMWLILRQVSHRSNLKLLKISAYTVFHNNVPKYGIAAQVVVEKNV